MNRYDWGLLQTFFLVAKSGSLSAAARSGRMSQPTISRHIAQLEAQAGLRLLERAKTGITLTQDGIELYEHVVEMAKAVAGFDADASESTAGIAGTVRITASRIVSSLLLPDLLARFHVQNPAIRIELVSSDETENLHYREADIALRMFRPSQPDIITRKVAQLAMGAFAAHSYVERNGAPEQIEDILHHDVIGYDKSNLIIDGFANLGFKVSRDFFAFRSDDQVACWNMVVAGYGIGFNQIAVGNREPKVTRVGPPVTVSTLPLWLTAHPALKTNPAIRAVYDFLGSELKRVYGNA